MSPLSGGGERGYRVDAESAAGGHLIATAEIAKALTKNNAGDGGWHDNEDGLAIVEPVSSFYTTGGTHNGFARDDGLAPTSKVAGVTGVQVGPAVRRLTPLECERLQGWPEVDGRGWTDIPWNGKEHAPDSKRYQAAGNGVTATVAYWIAARLAEVLK